MKTTEIENQNEILNVDTIAEIYTELIEGVSKQIENLTAHLKECYTELSERQKEGKRPTILQKNVLLKLQNDLFETKQQKIKIEIFQTQYEREFLETYHNEPTKFVKNEKSNQQ